MVKCHGKDRLFEVRLAQNVLPLAGPSSSSYSSSTSDYSISRITTPSTLNGKYPTEFSAQFGIVW